jgi:hypothetical protein
LRTGEHADTSIGPHLTNHNAHLVVFWIIGILVWNKVISVVDIIGMVLAGWIMTIVPLRLDQFIRSQADLAEFKFAFET